MKISHELLEHQLVALIWSRFVLIFSFFFQLLFLILKLLLLSLPCIMEPWDYISSSSSVSQHLLGFFINNGFESFIGLGFRGSEPFLGRIGKYSFAWRLLHFRLEASRVLQSSLRSGAQAFSCLRPHGPLLESFFPLLLSEPLFSLLQDLLGLVALHRSLLS